MDIEREEQRGRWTAALATLSLAAIAAAFFLPVVRVGSGQVVVLPWDAARESVTMAAVVMPPFLLAAALALATLTGIFQRRGPHPSLAWIWIVVLAIAVIAVISGVIWSFFGSWTDPSGNWAALA